MAKNSFTHLSTGRGLQLTATLTATLSAISDGMHYAWTAPAIPILQSETSPIKISKNDETWLETIYIIGTLVGIPVTFYLVGRIGRRKLILTAAASHLLSWITIAFADRVQYLYVARFWAGWMSNVAFVVAPMYIAEIADQKIRGFLASATYIMWITGSLVVYSVAPFVPFYVPSIVGGVLLIIQLVVFYLMPESPYYLLWVGKRELARNSLHKLRGQQYNQSELEEISAGITREQREEGRLRDLLNVGNRKALFIDLLLTASQNFCGLSVMLMNLHTILLETRSVYLDSNTTAIIFAVVLLVSGIISSFVIDRFGRKVLLVSSCVLTGLCLLALGLYFNFKYLGRDVENLSWIPLVCVMAYAAVFNYGLGLVVTMMPSEIFSMKIKTMGMCVNNVLYMSFAYCSVELYQTLLGSYGFHVPFYFFAVVTFLASVVFTFVIPETKGKSLDEIQALLSGHTETSLS